MRIRRFEKSFKKACSVVLAFSMIVTSSALDFNVEYNKDTGVVVTSGKEAKAQSHSVGEDAIMADYITDTTLQTYLLEVYKSSVSGADQSKTVSSLKISDLNKITSKLSIPSGVKSVKGLGWVRNTTEIDMSACTQLTEIADDEFSLCKSLENVKLPSSVTKLGGDSFYQCIKLKKINLNNVTYIGDNAFASCEVLTDDSYATMKDTLTYLGSGAFNGCKALTTVKVPVLTDSKQAHTVPDSLFQNCERLSKVNFCDSSLEKIGASSFYYTGVITFKTSADTNYGNTLPKTVKNISSSAFAYSGIRSLDLSANTGLEEIQNYTFQKSHLMEITLPNKLKKIGDNAFEQTLISEIEMPNTVTEIGPRCFEWTPYLENVVLSTEITEIPLQCFEGAGNFYAHAYDPPTQELYVKYYEAKIYNRRLNISFNGTSKIKTIGRLAFQASAIGQDDFFTQLPALESIGEKSFTYTFLEKVTFPASLKEMGITTFGGSYFLEEVNFPEDSKLTELPERAFGYTGDAPNSAYAEICPSLKKVTLPDKLEIIGKNCFRACLQLKTVGRSSSIQENKVILDGPIKEVQDGAFANCAVYENAEEDRNYAKQILLDSDAKSNGVDEEKCSMIIEPTGISEVILSSEGSNVDMTFGSGVFEGDKMLEKVTTYDGAKELGKSMFLNCGSFVDSVSEAEFYKEYLADVDSDYEGEPMEFVGLKEVYLSKFTKTIGESAFSGCYNLSTFNDVNGTCPKALETIGNSAFSKCKSLTKVTINSNLKSIGNSAFAECSQGGSAKITDKASVYKGYYGLADIDMTFATTLSAIGSSAFSKTNIDSIKFPQGVKEIPSSVCESCFYLKTVENMASDVTSIGGNAFTDCFNLSSVAISYKAVWEKTMFSGYTGESGAISLKPVTNALSGEALDTDNVDVIFGRTNVLEAKCFSKFTQTEMELIDAAYEDQTIKTDLLKAENMDLNPYVTVEKEAYDSNITLIGKALGNVKLKLTGSIDFALEGSNKFGVKCSLPHYYNVNVIGNPFSSISISEGKEIIAGADGKKIVYIAPGKSISGITATYTAKIEGELPTEDMTWETLDTSVATVTTSPVDGKITTTAVLNGVSYGDTTLIARGEDGSVKDIVTVFVREPAKTVTVKTEDGTTEITSKNVDPNSTYQLNVELGYEDEAAGANYPDAVIFTSSDESIATVDESGKVTFIGNSGDVTITVTARASGVSKSVKFSILGDAKISSLQMDSEDFVDVNGTKTLYMNIAKTSAYKVTANYAPETTTSDISWDIDGGAFTDTSLVKVDSSSNSNGVATVSLLPQVLGKGTLNVKGGNLTDSCAIDVRVPAKNIKLLNAEKEDKSSETVATGEKYQLTAEIEYDEKYVEDAKTYPDFVEFSSSDTEIATVDYSTGLVTAVKAGTAKITAKCIISGVSKTFSLTIKDGYVPDATSIELNATKGEMNVGETMQLTSKILPAKANQTTKWSTSDDKKATVSETGLVTAVAPGDVTITAKSGDEKKSATCKITIYAPAKGLKIVAPSGNKKKAYVKRKQSIKLSAFCTNEKTTTDDIKFVAKKSKVGAVAEDGTVTTKRPGKIVVQLKAARGATVSSVAKLTVIVSKKAKKIKNITKIKGPKKVKVEGKISLMAVARPANATTPYKWTSSKTSVATVDECGIVTGVAKGTTVITVKNGRKKKKVKITVS